MPDTPTVILGSRWTFSLIGLAGLAFVVVAVFILTEAPPLLRWGTVAFFGLAIPLGVWGAISPPRLTLDDDAFDYRFMGRGWSVRWADLEGLHLWKNPAPMSSQTLVAWTYLPGREPTGAMAGVAASLGAPGALPGSWRLPPKALLATMEAYRARAR